MTEPVKFNNAMQGIQQGLESLHKNASKIASKSAMEAATPQELVKAMVDIKADEQQIKASMKVMKVTDEVLGTLLDIKA